jgi:hypothetical protein
MHGLLFVVVGKANESGSGPLGAQERQLSRCSGLRKAHMGTVMSGHPIILATYPAQATTDRQYFGSTPVMTPRAMVASSTVRANGPTTSPKSEEEIMPSSLTSPFVGLIPTSDIELAGSRTDPAASGSSSGSAAAVAANFAVFSLGSDRSGEYGFSTVPPGELNPRRPYDAVNSFIDTLPIITAPAAFNFVTRVASSGRRHVVLHGHCNAS